MACEDKQWCFTLDKTYEFGRNFYSLLETNKLFTTGGRLYGMNTLDASITLFLSQLNLSENVPTKQIQYEAGDILINTNPYSKEIYIYFMAQSTNDFDGLKVGELEKSYIEDFKSFVESKTNGNFVDTSFTFSIKEPELDTKIIVTSIIWLLLLLPLLLLIYFKFK